MDLQEYRKASLANWDRVAANWESEHGFIWGATRVVGERIVEKLDPRPGDTISTSPPAPATRGSRRRAGR